MLSLMLLGVLAAAYFLGIGLGDANDRVTTAVAVKQASGTGQGSSGTGSGGSHAGPEALDLSVAGGPRKASPVLLWALIMTALVVACLFGMAIQARISLMVTQYRTLYRLRQSSSDEIVARAMDKLARKEAAKADAQAAAEAAEAEITATSAPDATVVAPTPIVDGVPPATQPTDAPLPQSSEAFRELFVVARQDGHVS